MTTLIWFEGAKSTEIPMRFVVDGYNLAHALGIIRGNLSGSSLDIIRKSLLLHLKQYEGTRPEDIIMVFDGQRSRNQSDPSQYLYGFPVIFSQNEQADDVIEDLIHQEKQPLLLTVVSNDHRLKEAAKRSGCRYSNCLDFVENLMVPSRTKPIFQETQDKPDGITPEEVKEWMRDFHVDDRND